MIIWVCLKSGSTSQVAILYKSGVQPSYVHTHVVGEKQTNSVYIGYIMYIYIYVVNIVCSSIPSCKLT